MNNVLKLAQNELDALDNGHLLIIHFSGRYNAFVDADLIISKTISIGAITGNDHYQLLAQLRHNNEGIDTMHEVWEFSKCGLIRSGFKLELIEEDMDSNICTICNFEFEHCNCVDNVSCETILES